MTANLLSPHQKVYGNLISGGTESILLAIYAYKNYYSNRTKLNM
jgi:glutamate/tyrosine decarboxylase-like PLP-dependent enzyme